MKATNISETMIHYWEVSVKYLEENVIAPLPGKNSVICGKFTGLLESEKEWIVKSPWYILKIQISEIYSFWLGQVFQKKDFVLRFANPYNGVFWLINVITFA